MSMWEYVNIVRPKQVMTVQGIGNNAICEVIFLMIEHIFVKILIYEWLCMEKYLSGARKYKICRGGYAKKLKYSTPLRISNGIALTLSEQIAHSTIDLHFKEIIEFFHGRVMNKNLHWAVCTYAVQKLHLNQAAQHTCIKFSRYAKDLGHFWLCYIRITKVLGLSLRHC